MNSQKSLLLSLKRSKKKKKSNLRVVYLQQSRFPNIHYSIEQLKFLLKDSELEKSLRPLLIISTKKLTYASIYAKQN